MIQDDLFSGNRDEESASFDADVERIMQAFSPHVRDRQEKSHPEWSHIVKKVKQAAALLKRHENRSAVTGIGPVEYTDWCFYPEPDGSISRLAIHADLRPIRSKADQAAHDNMVRDLETALHSLQYTLRFLGHTLTVLIPVAANPA